MPTTSEIPTSVLELYQWIIASMAVAVSTLGGANVWQWREANTVMKARLQERDVLNKALTDANNALKELSETSQRRNDITEKLGELIGQVSIALKMLSERLELQHEHTNKDLEKAIEVVETMADALRAVAMELQKGFSEVKAEIRK
jgi:hypothetical protein